MTITIGGQVYFVPQSSTLVELIQFLTTIGASPWYQDAPYPDGGFSAACQTEYETIQGKRG